VAYDASGTERWVARYNGPGDVFPDGATAIALDAAGNVYVTGWSTGGPYNPHYATLKYSQP